MYSAIARNKRNTILLMLGFVVAIGVIGLGVGYYYNNLSLFYYVLIGAIIYAVIQYYSALKMAQFSTGAKEIEKKDNPRLYRIVENLSITNGMPMPKVCVIEDDSPNAFATGRDPKNAMVAATTGILNLMNDRELEAVFAHEMAHVKNYDIRVSLIAFGLVATISMLAEIGLHMLLYSNSDNRKNPIAIALGIAGLILIPIIATVIQMTISRQREYLADASGVRTTRDPEGLASALEKLLVNQIPMKKQNKAAAHLFFANPLKSGGVNAMFSTHPPLEDRIAKLRGELTSLN